MVDLWDFLAVAFADKRAGLILVIRWKIVCNIKQVMIGDDSRIWGQAL